MTQRYCADDSAGAREQLIGSAPLHTGWLCLEQPGPWGRKALTGSHLDASLGRRIEDACGEVGIRPALIRRPGRHAQVDAARTLLLAHIHPDNPWLIRRTLHDPAEVLGLDFAALAAGDRSAFDEFEDVGDEVLLVCTNGKRDTCCARLGRPVAEAAAAAYPDRVWEVSHTGGHRFAPTGVLLPSGHLHGRVLDGEALLEAADRGELPLLTWRGRGSWPAEGQVAEDLVRRTEGIVGLHDLRVAGESEQWQVSHRDGREWQVGVTRETHGERAESCGKAPTPIVQRSASFNSGSATA